MLCAPQKKITNFFDAKHVTIFSFPLQMPAKTIITRLNHVTIARRANTQHRSVLCRCGAVRIFHQKCILPTPSGFVQTGLLASQQAFLNTSSFSASTVWLIKKLGLPAKSSEPFLGSKPGQKTMPFKLGLPSCNRTWTNAADFNLTVESEYVQDVQIVQ